jgi:hypothetical protein
MVVKKFKLLANLIIGQVKPTDIIDTCLFTYADDFIVSFDMVQDSTENRHVIEIPMDLPRDIEFKFIVDGEWRYANDLPHRTDWRKVYYL